MKTSIHIWIASSFKACLLAVAISIPVFFTSCTVKTGAYKDSSYSMEVSVPQQKMALYHKGTMVRKYPVSTSKFGEGDEEGSYRTPLGKFEVAEKIGTGKPLGAVFKSRIWTGEILKPNSPGRDPIVSRILWLHGLEKKNKNAYGRCIYIHGTAAEHEIGTKASYGCVRMKSRDIIQLYDKVAWGSQVEIVNRPLWSGIDNPNLPLNEDGTIPVMYEKSETLFTDPSREPMAWIRPLDDITTREDLINDGFEEDYFDIEPEL